MLELCEYLDTFYPDAKQRIGYVFSEKMRGYKGFSELFRKELVKAGIEPWVKPLQNL